MLTFSLLCADSSLGKMDPSMLSDQARMELFVANLEEGFRTYFQADDGTFLDMCEWSGMACDDAGNVTDVSLVGVYAGTACLDFLPESVETLNVSSNEDLKGTLNTSKLPSRLEVCDLDANNFDGIVDMAKLPESLYSFSIAQNNFSGDCDLTALPVGLEKLNASENAFSGSLRLDSLHEGMFSLDVSCNYFSGSVSLENLPDSLEEFQINMNQLSGRFVLVKPGSLYVVYAHSNRFSGEATIPRVFASREAHITLGRTNVSAVVDENGAAHPLEKKFLSSTE